MKYRSDLELFHGKINDPIKRAKQEYNEIVARYGTPLYVITNDDWPSSYVGCVYIEHKDMKKREITYRIRYSFYEDDSFLAKIPDWFGGERLKIALRFETANECDWDESDECWADTFERFTVLPGDIDFEVEYAA